MFCIFIFRELYFNYRICHQDKFDEEGYPKIDSDLSIDRFNLVTKSHSKNLLSGHKAFSNYPAWYICLDICQDYIVRCVKEYLSIVGACAVFFFFFFAVKSSIIIFKKTVELCNMWFISFSRYVLCLGVPLLLSYFVAIHHA